jgi:hypothetical protein
METVLAKLISVLTEPVQLVMLLWITYMVKDKYDLQKINRELLAVQQERGIILTKITTMIEIMMKGGKSG